MTNDFMTTEMSEADRKAEELQRNFSFDGYQVVRRELFAHLRDPAVTIRRDSVTFNAACISGLEDAVYIHLMINPDTKKMVVRKCDENDKNALRWCVAKDDKRKSRNVTSRPFSDMLYKLMGWEKRNRYKILGYRIKYEYQGTAEDLYIFDLIETEVFNDTKRKDPNFVDELADDPNENTADKPKPFLSDNLTGTYGMPIEDNQRALQLNINGYMDGSEFENREDDY